MPDKGAPKPRGGKKSQGSRRPKAAPKKHEAAARPTDAAEPAGAGGAVTAVTGAPRLRRWLALILVVMAVVGLVISALALWSDSLVFNTDK